MRQGNTTYGKQAAQKLARRYELDWIRMIVVLGLIPVHTAPIFTPTADIYLKNSDTSASLIYLGTFVGVFGMPLLFFVSGAASWFALGSRSGKRYAQERVLRLFVPLVFASLAVVPIQAYVVVLSNPSLVSLIGAPIYSPHFLDSFLSFYPQYLLSYAYFLAHPSPVGFIAFIGQLWFLLCLFLYSLVALPLFIYLRSPRGQRQIDRLAAFCAYPGAVFAFAAPLALVDALAHVMWTGMGAIAELLLYLAFFVTGYVFYADVRFGQAIRRHWGLSLAAGATLWIFAELFLVEQPPRPYDNTMGTVLSIIPLRGIIAWLWVVGLVGFAMTFLNKATRLLRLLAGAAYPIYVLHVAVIMSVGYFVIQWEAPLLIKFFFIMTTAFFICLGIYEFLIRRVRILRLLFGLRASSAPEPPKPLTATGATI